MNEHGVSIEKNWRHRSGCRDETDKDLFFRADTTLDQERVGRGDKASLVAARAICNSCDVSADCLAWALETNQGFGVWGGLTTPQRQRLKRSR